MLVPGFYFLFTEEITWNEPLLFEEPAEDHPRDQADKADGITTIPVFGCILWESNVVKRPKIPIG